jgi:hypothetical protein
VYAGSLTISDRGKKTDKTETAETKPKKFVGESKSGKFYCDDGSGPLNIETNSWMGSVNIFES